MAKSSLNTIMGHKNMVDAIIMTYNPYSCLICRCLPEVIDKNLKVLKKKINKDLAHLFDWLCANRLSLNTKKTEFILFRPNGKHELIKLRLNQTTIRESPKISYLGILLDNKLSWKFHISELCKKLGRSIGLLYKKSM